MDDMKNRRLRKITLDNSTKNNIDPNSNGQSNVTPNSAPQPRSTPQQSYTPQQSPPRLDSTRQPAISQPEPQATYSETPDTVSSNVDNMPTDNVIQQPESQQPLNQEVVEQPSNQVDRVNSKNQLNPQDRDTSTSGGKKLNRDSFTPNNNGGISNNKSAPSKPGLGGEKVADTSTAKKQVPKVNQLIKKDKPENTLNRTSNKIKNFVKTTTGTFNTVLMILTSPITWIVLGVGLVMMISMSGMSTLGRSDYGANCATATDIDDSIDIPAGGGGGGGSHDFKAGGKARENAEALFKAYVDKGLSGAAAAGIVGWVNSEGGFSIIDRAEGCYQESSKCQISNGAIPINYATGNTPNGGGGIFQFTPYTKFAPVGDKKWLSMKAQADFALNAAGHGDWNPAMDLTGKNNSFMDFATSNNVHDAALMWNAYERGNMQIMLEHGVTKTKPADAQVAYKMFNGAKYKADTSKLAKNFGGSSSGGGSSASSSDDAMSGDSDHCITDDGGASDGSIAGFARSIAYKMGERDKANVQGGDKNGGSVAPDAYKKAVEKLEKAGQSGRPAGLYASCDVFVATVIKSTVDKEFPWVNSGAQLSYLRSSDKWKKINCKDRKEGDVIEEVPTGHAMIYGGGNKMISASLYERVGDEHDYSAGTCAVDGTVIGADGVSNPSEVYRFVGKADPAK